MPQFHVQYARRANQDVAKLLEWLQTRSAQGAARWLDALDEANNRLSESPLSFGLAEEADFFPELVRQILIRTRHGSTYRALLVLLGLEWLNGTV